MGFRRRPPGILAARVKLRYTADYRRGRGGVKGRSGSAPARVAGSARHVNRERPHLQRADAPGTGPINRDRRRLRRPEGGGRRAGVPRPGPGAQLLASTTSSASPNTPSSAATRPSWLPHSSRAASTWPWAEQGSLGLTGGRGGGLRPATHDARRTLQRLDVALKLGNRGVPGRHCCGDLSHGGKSKESS